MQARSEDESDLIFNPSASSGFCEEFASKAVIEESDKLDKLDGDEEEEEEEDEDDFTFCVVDDESISSSTAEDMFQDGKIRPIFPLFDQSLVKLPHLPPVRKVFVEAGAPPPHPDMVADGEAAGPYCAWSVEAAAASMGGSCKKSNSTGFSKIWRFKEMSSRSNSDGRDAFVFLHKWTAEKKGKDSAAAATVANKKKGGVKAKAKASSSAASAHEAYVKSRAAATREEDRRRSYLPYKPELVGFFTNVHGGMSKNVHPF